MFGIGFFGKGYFLECDLVSGFFCGGFLGFVFGFGVDCGYGFAIFFLFVFLECISFFFLL